MGIPLADIEVRSHDTDISYTSEKSAIITPKPSETQPGSKDFILRYRLQGSQILSGIMLQEGEKENFFLTMIEAPERVIPRNIPAREYIFVVDTSGSMDGFPIETAKTLMKELLGDLRNTDTFNIVLFAGNTAHFRFTSVPASKHNISRAMTFMESQNASGSTMMLEAIQSAMNWKKKKGSSRSVVIITDGYVDAESEVFQYIHSNLGQANFFSFGIGSSVNRHLIEGVARAGKG